MRWQDGIEKTYKVYFNATTFGASSQIVIDIWTLRLTPNWTRKMGSFRNVWSPVTLNEVVPLVRLPFYVLGLLALVIVLNALQQVFLPRPKSQPPVVFHWLPFVGNAVSYGADPLRFFNECQQKVRQLPIPPIPDS